MVEPKFPPAVDPVQYYPVTVADLCRRAQAIAGNRTAGASELVDATLALLDDAVASGRVATVETVRVICGGQPAMAALWNVSAAAVAEFESAGRYARVRAEVTRARAALTRAATQALSDALMGVTRPQLLTLSYSASVARVLAAVARDMAIDVICAESRPALEGARMRDELASIGAATELVSDAAVTTYLPTATAVVVGADAVSSRDWVNKAGTFGLAAAAAYTGTPVFVICSRAKAEADVLRRRSNRSNLPREFERTPVELATLFLMDAGPVTPDRVKQLSEGYATDLAVLLAVLSPGSV